VLSEEGDDDQGCQVKKKIKKGQILFYSTFKKAKKGPMAKPFNFWQTVSKRPNLAGLVFFKVKWQP